MSRNSEIIITDWSTSVPEVYQDEVRVKERNELIISEEKASIL